MLFSYKELKRLANLNKETTLKQVVNAINSIGFEVEKTQSFANVEGIKFGKIIEIYQNPNADNLKICEIQFDDQKRTIQTNATNVFENMYVIAFVPGSKNNKMTFGTKELKGIKSEGMLSSISEFGIKQELLREESTSGIQSYPEINLSIDPIEYLGLNDTLIDIDILSNRSDAQSYIVMANELSAYFHTKPIELKDKENNMINTLEAHNSSLNKELVFIEAKNDFKISLKEQIFLAKSGIKSVNDIIDLTNLTLIMTGQPIKAYKKEKIHQNFSTKLISGKFKLSNDKEIELNNNLVVTSNDKPISIAGIQNINESQVLNYATNFILELGIFNIKEVRKSLQTIKTSTFSGIQSSKVITKGTIEYALKYLSSKLKYFSNTINFDKPRKKEIEFDKEYLNKIAGFDIVNHSKFIKVLESLNILGFKLNKEENRITIPSYRHDVNTKQDLNEEIFRFFGYDFFPLIDPKITSFKVSKDQDFKKEISSQGYKEVMTYTLLSKEKNIFNPFNLKQTIELKTFVSKEREVIRNSQIFSILSILEYNQKRNIKDINIFSEGMINNGIKTIIIASSTKSFWKIKQDIINIFPNNIEFKSTQDEQLHPGVSADIYLNNQKIGFLGKINPKISNNESFIAELLLNAINNNKEIKYNEYDKSPLKHRDVTFVLEKGQNIISKIQNINVIEYKVIDSFKKENQNKITVRFLGTDQQIKDIDKDFN